MSAPRLVLAVITGAALIGCGAVLGFEDVTYTSDANDAGDTSDAVARDDAPPFEDALAEDAPWVADAMPDGDASLAVDASGGCVNLILNGGFESKPTCDPWISYGGPDGIDTTAHSGARACRACAGSGAVNLLPNVVAPPLAVGDTVHFEAWVRAADSALFAVKLEVQAFTSATDTTTASYVMSDTYKKMWVDHVITADSGSSLGFEMLAGQQSADPDAGAHECILFDDVVACVIHDGG